ncbi:uncharacterized protein FIBRA_04984 [Fibroporia radiculosa]|uniref:Uncharacterized protein n=1 Tax=Fibroporia radiculosa TaxID=599839 RepID=J4IAG5_9APHY|nr:uncharacterized protein FIBRA_04984 [Fibroporia radiculosa]CCM02871.1 predicted protein [Fibroporia radiculosa]
MPAFIQAPPAPAGVPFPSLTPLPHIKHSHPALSPPNTSSAFITSLPPPAPLTMRSQVRLYEHPEFKADKQDMTLFSTILFVLTLAATGAFIILSVSCLLAWSDDCVFRASSPPLPPDDALTRDPDAAFASPGQRPAFLPLRHVLSA